VSPVPAYQELPLVHFTQQYDWDCGIACVMMALNRRQRQHFLTHFEAICQEEQFGHSTWTIDLCFLLRRYNKRHKFNTKVVGVNRAYQTASYYQNSLAKDENRILEKFQLAPLHDIPVDQKTVDYPRLIEHLTRSGPIILLVNAHLLICDLCKTNKLSKELLSCFPVNRNKYAGHYVIMCGFNLTAGKFLYRNPACDDR
jgi:Guanylylate cyclase